MTNPKDTMLYTYRSDREVTLAEAIQYCSQFLAGAIALLYSPSSCQIAKFSDRQLSESDGSAIAPKSSKDVFEARVFNQNCELRWLNHDDGKGDAVLLSESEVKIDAFSLIESQSCEPLKQQYLLWGEATNTVTTQGWQRLAEARIGKLDIPLNGKLKENQRVYLCTLEYLAEIDDFGNFAVVDERLVKLEAK